MLNYFDCISTLLVTITTQTQKKCLQTKITNSLQNLNMKDKIMFPPKISKSNNH